MRGREPAASGHVDAVHNGVRIRYEVFGDVPTTLLMMGADTDAAYLVAGHPPHARHPVPISTRRRSTP